MAKDDGRKSSTIDKVHALLNPRNVVIAGASDKPGNWSGRVWRNLKRYGYPHPVYPYNPARDAIFDTKCYRGFADLPEAPDHVVVLVPTPHVPALLREAAAAGARSATVITAGFEELPDPASKALGEELRRVVVESDLALSGPNCLGNFNASAQFFTMPDDRKQKFVEGPVAIVAQSGGIVLAIKRTLEERGIDTCALVTSGNETGLTAGDYIAYYATLPHVKVIVAYLEAINNPAGFLDALRAAARAGKPVVIFKLGSSEESRKAAAAHTGALAGSTEAFDAVAGAAGALRVRSMDDLVETVEFLVHARKPRGRNLAAVTYSGGMRGLVVEAVATHGLAFAPMGEDLRRKIGAVLRPGGVVDNPLDAAFATVGGIEGFLKCVEAYLAAPEIDMLLMQEELPRAPGTARQEEVLRRVNDLADAAGKPVAFIGILSYGLNDYSRAVRADLPNLAVMQEPDRALRAVRSALDYYARMETPPVDLSTRKTPDGRAMLEEILARPGATILDEVESKRLLAAYGLAGPREMIARAEAEALDHAQRIGYPVVAKIVSPDIAHKSDMGGVRLNIWTPEHLRAAWRDLEAAVARHPGKPRFEGVLIAEQMSGGVEFAIGASRDREMGPVILCGAGGVGIELTRDFALAPPPLDERAARALIERTRLSALLKGFRGRPPLDTDALARALVGLSRLIEDAGDRIEQIDVNPLVVREKGAVALDGLVVLKA